MTANNISVSDSSPFCRLTAIMCGKVPVWMLLCLTLFFSVTAPPVNADDFSVEYAVKSALLLNFARFTDWPADSLLLNSERIVISIVGSDPFADTINKTLKGKTAKGKPVSILRVQRVADLPAAGSHIVFLAADHPDQLFEWANSLITSQSLVVSEHAEALMSKADVQFLVNESSKVRFRLNLPQIKGKGLSLRSAMQKAAMP